MPDDAPVTRPVQSTTLTVTVCAVAVVRSTTNRPASVGALSEAAGEEVGVDVDNGADAVADGAVLGTPGTVGDGGRLESAGGLDGPLAVPVHAAASPTSRRLVVTRTASPIWRRIMTRPFDRP